ncbi:unnamed protein product [Closterium sp. NIES-64]|nr:unnamed protein product [Closterium sp. NIES-64]
MLSPCSTLLPSAFLPPFSSMPALLPSALIPFFSPPSLLLPFCPPPLCSHPLVLFFPLPPLVFSPTSSCAPLDLPSLPPSLSPPPRPSPLSFPGRPRRPLPLRSIASTLPRLSSLNRALLSSFMRGGSWMFPRLPAWQPGTPLVDRVPHAMWRHVCSYKLATETQLDESAVCPTLQVTEQSRDSVCWMDAACLWCSIHPADRVVHTMSSLSSFHARTCYDLSPSSAKSFFHPYTPSSPLSPQPLYSHLPPYTPITPSTPTPHIPLTPRIPPAPATPLPTPIRYVMDEFGSAFHHNTSVTQYVMDEFGSAFRHSDRPNFRCAPFLFLPDGSFASALSYSILWPVAAVRPGEECTRDYLAGVGEEHQRSPKLCVWFHTPSSAFHQAYEQRLCRFAAAATKHAEATALLASTASDNKEDKGGEGKASESADKPERTELEKRVYRVFTDLPYVTDNLSRPEFTFVDTPSEADIIWTSMQVDDAFREAAGLKGRREKGGPEPLVNQFPFEACIVMKHHLAKTIQQVRGGDTGRAGRAKAYGNTRPWLQDTYNMQSEMAALIGCFKGREAAAAAAAGKRLTASYGGNEAPESDAGRAL